MISNKTKIFIKWFYWEALQCGYTTREIVEHLMYDIGLPRGSIGAYLLEFSRDIEEIIYK